MKNTGEQISIIYIFGKSRFLNPAKASSGGNLRKRFELSVIAAWFGAQTKDKLRYTVDYLLDKENLYWNLVFYGSSKRSCNDMGLVPKFR